MLKASVSVGVVPEPSRHRPDSRTETTGLDSSLSTSFSLPPAAKQDTLCCLVELTTPWRPFQIGMHWSRARAHSSRLPSTFRIGLLVSRCTNHWSRSSVASWKWTLFTSAAYAPLLTSTKRRAPWCHSFNQILLVLVSRSSIYPTREVLVSAGLRISQLIASLLNPSNPAPSEFE